jgi:primosomal protein N' (replication factor Y)
MVTPYLCGARRAWAQQSLSTADGSGPDPAAVDNVCAALARRAPHQDGVTILGPSTAPLALLRGRHRRRFLLKTSRDIAVQPLLRTWLERIGLPGSVRLQIDVDPYSFM